MSVYLDNSATSFPKPECVIEAMNHYFHDIGANAGRSAHKKAQEAARMVFEAREAVARLINTPDSSRVAFTAGTTEGLNITIPGLLNEGDEVITTSMEHNSVMRPIRYLEKTKGIKVTVVQCSPQGLLDPDDVKKSVTDRTKLIVTTAKSNAFGTLIPLKDVGGIARDHGIPYCVDAAQAMGVVPVDVQRDCIDILAFSGHKGLMGPQGIGSLYVREGLKPAPIKRGGTGSNSREEIHPDFMPDVYESGTPNLIGIAGFGAAVEFILNETVEVIFTKEQELSAYMYDSVRGLAFLDLYGPLSVDEQMTVLPFNVKGKTASEVGDIFDRDYDIACRCGLHCAPSAHKTIGTFPDGCVRISLGFYNAKEDIDILCKALQEITA